MPFPKSFDTGVVREDAALAATMAGDFDMALDELETLLSTPVRRSNCSGSIPGGRRFEGEERYRKLVGAPAGASSAAVYN